MGYSSSDEESPGRMLLLGSEEFQLPFEVLPTANVITMPRRIFLEGWLVRMLDRGASLPEKDDPTG